MSIKIVNPVTEDNKDNLDSSEKKNNDLYKNVNESTMNDLNKYLEIYNEPNN